MDPDAIITALVVACSCLAVSTIGFAVSWVRSRERAIRAGVHHLSAETESLLDRLSQGQDQAALELERLAEGQRFLTKILAQRPEIQSGAAPRKQEG